ncbi:hypothetical protein B296_00018460 [Ensete ventricosum]|uniref:Uncharacterized protein n=1 Tax=Ensete ventricosum TaxID=4639 RepID=A0A427B3S9_ENSVE|nr:hypothetical protein B296_00018460 [Ensete ventricosum]
MWPGTTQRMLPSMAKYSENSCDQVQDPDNSILILPKLMDFESYYATKCPRAMLCSGVTRECEATDSRAMGMEAPWCRRGGTSVESSIPCSRGGRALVVKGAERWRMQRQTPNIETRPKSRDQGTS